MILRVNGEEKEFAEEIKTLKHLVDALEIPCQRIAVERNGEIEDPGSFEQVYLEEEDRIEIVAFVGGG